MTTIDVYGTEDLRLECAEGALCLFSSLIDHTNL